MRDYLKDKATFNDLVLPPAWLHGQTETSLSGRIVGYTGDMSKVRARLVGMYGGAMMEAIPDKEGNFSLPANRGIYILMTVIEKGTDPSVADWRELRVTGADTVTVDLSRVRHGQNPWLIN